MEEKKRWCKKMAKIEVKCPKCDETEVNKYGTSSSGAQRYYCKNENCSTTIFQLKYHNKGCEPGMEKRIIKMAVNASGVRDTARVLEISTYKVMDTLKKQKR
jgi:transposase-like protein